MTKPFELSGRLVVHADDLPDAYRKLAEHFAAAARGEFSPHIPTMDYQMRLRAMGTSQGMRAARAPELDPALPPTFPDDVPTRPDHRKP